MIFNGLTVFCFQKKAAQSGAACEGAGGRACMHSHLYLCVYAHMCRSPKAGHRGDTALKNCRVKMAVRQNSAYLLLIRTHKDKLVL